MKLASCIVLAAAAAAVAAAAQAGKISMAKEGPYELKFCTVGSGATIVATDKAYASHYTGVALLNAVPTGGPFDRQAAKCWGTIGIIGGKASHLGYCEMVDMEGDKWLMEYHGKEDNSGGTYTAVLGTGKYDGMTLKGEYKLDFYPGLGPDGYSGCHHNKGIYKLR
jgi:hypothetical protein